MGVYLHEMAARTRKEALEKVTTLFDKATSEIIKITIYENSTDDKSHWKSKLNTYLMAINSIKISDGSKLKEVDYLDATNLSNYEDSEDFFIRIVEFYDDYIGSDRNKVKEYPEFDITDNSISIKCYRHWNNIRAQVCELFADKRNKGMSFKFIIDNEFN